jgi:putative transposase
MLLSIFQLVSQSRRWRNYSKESSSHWINANDLIMGKFAWGRGYGAFSVSESNVGQVAAYIAGQGQHHRFRTFAQEFKEFIHRYGLRQSEEGSH